LDGGDPTSFPGWNEGWFAVQDHASAAVTAALGPLPGDRVLDACAGPGGKTAHIACSVGGQGRVVASELHPRRAELVRATCRRLGVPADVLAMDAARPAVHGPYDRILVDGPCSGIGSARRRPELLWRVRASGLSRLARLQVSIAAAVTDLLRPGGRLVYSVCTFPRAETDAVCDALLRHRTDLIPAKVDPARGDDPRRRLWPHTDGSDGLFIAAFERVARSARPRTSPG
jgi:16S rRNA (cytosine967-C5)-methyltransferase